MLAISTSLLISVFPIVGYIKKIPQWSSFAKIFTPILAIEVLIAYVILTVAFVLDKYEIAYVAGHSNSLLPLIYKFTAVWGGHEGSMLLWMLFLALWMLSVSAFMKGIPSELGSLMLAVLALVSFGILSFIYLTSNPFDLSEFFVLDGSDLNPLLQDPGMAIHPPMLYLGYVGLAIPFAFSVACLIIGKLESSHVAWLRPWLSMSWAFLTIGITLGSWWAYYELGWGGWWFWDPVENASFMPWLIATALIHSAAVTQTRSIFKSWFVLLSIIGFSLSLLGTFLVRSGVLVSVHAFAADPSRGLFILLLIGLILGGSLLLFMLRAEQLKSAVNFNFLSKEAFLLINNLLLLVASLSILLGTLYPLVVDALGLGKLSVGAPYFEIVFLYLMLPLMLCIGIGIHVDWIKSKDKNLKHLKSLAAIILIISLIVLYSNTNSITVLMLLGFWFSFWIMFSTIFLGLKTYKDRNYSYFLKQTPMLVAHIGLAVFILGVTFVKNFSVTTDQVMTLNQTVNFADSDWLFSDLVSLDGPNYSAIQAEIISTSSNERITFNPQRRLYFKNENAMTEADIDASIIRDLFVAMGDPVSSNEWQFRIQYRPFIRGIWLGALIMALGGLISAFLHIYKPTNKKPLL